MLDRHINNLQASIQWAQCQDDIDILCMARDNMNQLISFITTLPEAQQQAAYRHVDGVLPMEWPIWMEACRYSEADAVKNQGVTVH